MDHVPSYAEHSGPYNVNEEEYWQQIAQEPDDSVVFWRTAERLPPLTWDEFRGVCALIYEVLEERGRSDGFTAEEAKTFYRYTVGDATEDRTAQIGLADESVLDERLVRRLQERVLSRHPLWRIVFVCSAYRPESFVTVYPAVVRVGMQPVDVDWAAALRGVVAAELEATDRVRGAEDRQIAWLRPMLLHEMSNLEAQEQPFRMIGVFDNWRRNREEWSVWFLHRGRSWTDLQFEEPVAYGTGFAVRSDGDFGSHYAPDESDHWLQCVVVPADAGEITVQWQQNHKPVGPPVRVQIDPRAILKDADLRSAGLR